MNGENVDDLVRREQEAIAARNMPRPLRRRRVPPAAPGQAQPPPGLHEDDGGNDGEDYDDADAPGQQQPGGFFGAWRQTFLGGHIARGPGVGGDGEQQQIMFLSPIFRFFQEIVFSNSKKCHCLR